MQKKVLYIPYFKNTTYDAQKKDTKDFPVSCPVFKKLGSHHFISTSKKQNKLKIQQLFLDL